MRRVANPTAVIALCVALGAAACSSGSSSTAGAKRTIRLHESHSSGGLGYALCTVTVQIPPAGGGPGAGGGTSRASWDATIWQRDSGGIWRIAVDISTRLPSSLPS